MTMEISDFFSILWEYFRINANSSASITNYIKTIYPLPLSNMGIKSVFIFKLDINVGLEKQSNESFLYRWILSIPHF